MAEGLSNSILFKELKIYQWIFSIFGLNFPPFLLYRQEKDVKYYLVLVIYLLYSLILIGCAMWACHKHNLIVRTATLGFHLDFLTEMITYIQNVGMAVLQILMEYKSCCCHQSLLEIMQLIKILEQNMLKICPVIFRDQKLRRRLLLTTGLSLIFMISFLIYLNYALVANDMKLMDKLLVMFFLMTVQMKFLEYGIYVQLIFEYLLMLLKSLKCLKGKVENEVDRQQPLAGYYQKILRKNKECLLEIWVLVHKLEQYFAWPILLLFFYNGVIILSTVSWAYVQYLFEANVVYQLIRLAYISVILFNMLLLCYLTQNCINEYQKFSHVLLNFKLYPHDVQMIMIVKEYSLQLMHQPIKFTCNGYMDVDLSTYGKTTLVIFSYAVILIQFKLADVSEGVITATNIILERF